MTKRINKATDYSTSQPLSGVLGDWMEAINQLRHWNTLLQKAIDEQTDFHSRSDLVDDENRVQLIELVQLKNKIVSGLDELRKDLVTTEEETSIAQQALMIIEDTQTVLQWCLDIKKRLNF